MSSQSARWKDGEYQRSCRFPRNEASQAEITEGAYGGKIALTIAKAEARGGQPRAMANTGFTVS
jgi:hypothetical protein